MKLSLIKNQSGAILIIVMMILLMISIIGIQMYSVSIDDVNISGNDKNSNSAFYSAESGLAIAKSTLWGDYLSYSSAVPFKQAGKIGNRATYTTYLETLGIQDGSTVKIVDSLAMGTLQTIDSVTVKRQDVAGATVLTVTSVGRSSDMSEHTIKAVYQVEGEAFKGFEFAILANNVNCIMCHATIDNTDRVYNNDTALVGTFDRVKVAALESMLIRTSSADSYIAGTLYTRGIVTDKAGNPITDLSPGGGGLEGFAMDASGKILEPLTITALVDAGGLPPAPFQNLYMNYPTDAANMTDGTLPDKFPPPFPDNNGNKVVDDVDYNEVAGNTTGSITGGIIYGVASTGTYAAPNLPGAGNLTSISQQYDGNLILVGTAANPIIINNDVAVNGDVIIKGVVKGTGQIYSRGNVYVPGDLTYADGSISGNRTFGQAADGTRNALSVAAGGNIVVGDYLTLKKSSLTDTSPATLDPGNLSGGENFSFAMSEITLFNRAEWTKTQEFLPDAGGTLVLNSTYDPTYKPRYYTLNDGDPVYVYNKMDASGKGTYWDPATKSWQGKEHASNYDLGRLTMIAPGDPQLAGASVVSLSSKNNWISAQTFKQIWANDEVNRPSGSDFKIDGQLYTNNSIFTLARKRSNSLGKMTVNGALVASDIGVLVGNGLNLNYDQRLKNFLKIKDDSQIMISRVAWYSE